jgi:HEAT repeat
MHDKKFPIRETATKAIGRLLCYRVQSEDSLNTLQLLQLLVSVLQDDSSEVRRRALSCIKTVAKVLLETFSFKLSIKSKLIVIYYRDPLYICTNLLDLRKLFKKF